MTGRLTDLWRRLAQPAPRVDQVIRVGSMSDLPEQLDRRTVYLVGQPDFMKWAVLDCPCGRGHRLALNLSTSRRPHWRVAADDRERSPRLSPSVDSLIGSKRCHFWLHDGHVRWCRDATGWRRGRRGWQHGSRA